MIKRLLIICLLLTGCYDYKEVSNLAVVVAVAVDQGSDKALKLNLQILHPYNDDVEGSVIMASGEGDSFSEALNNIQKRLMLEIFLGHLQIIVISEHISDIRPVVSYLINDAIAAKNASLLITDDGEKMLEAIQKDYLVPAIKIKQLLVDREGNGIVDISLDQFVATTLAQGIDPVVPYARLIDSGEEKTLSLDGMAGYKNYQFQGNLTEQLSIFIALMRGVSGRYYLPFNVDDYNGAFAVAQYVLSTSQSYKNEQVLIKKSMHLKLDLLDIGVDMKLPRETAVIDSKERLLAFIHANIEPLQQLSYDPVGIERYFYLYNNSLWKSISQDKIKEARWEVAIDMELDRTGAVSYE